MKPLKINIIQELSESGKLTGILLLIATILSLVFANSIIGYTDIYQIKVGYGILTKSIEHWVNDGLMAVFFFLVGLEIKREVLAGELSDVKKSGLSLISALGGVALPALIFVMFNYGTEYIHGWAIPTATDIAFSLGILSLLGNRVPISLKLFLTGLAVIDDLIAVLIIALFYTSEINTMYLLYSGVAVLVLMLLNRFKVLNTFSYIFVGLFLWFFFLKSGVHATIAGVLLAMFIPLSKVEHIEHSLHKWVNYLIMPIFALVNTAIVFDANSLANINSTLSHGISMGLVFGKGLGIFLFAYLGVKLGIASLPQDSNFKHIIGIAFIAGIGFTMSIFISKLSFADLELINTSILSVIIGSIISGIIGYVILSRVNHNERIVK